MRLARPRTTRRLLSQLPAPWEATYAASTRAELLAAYEAWAPTYDADSVGSFGYAAPGAAALALERHVADASAAVVLDAGAGTGQVGEHLSRLGFSHVLGVDLSAPMLRIAATKGCYRELLRGDLADRTLLPPGSLDAVVCVGTLTPNHVEDGATLHTWLEWLRPGGVICASIRDDFWEGSPLPNACQRLQEEGLWTLVEETESARYTPLVNDVAFRVRTWRKAVDCLASGST